MQTELRKKGEIMFYCLPILILLSILIIAKDFRNGFNWILIGELFSVGLMLVSILMSCMFAVQVYGASQYRLFNLDRMIFISIRRNARISYFTASTMGNIAITAYSFFLYLMMRHFRINNPGMWVRYGICTVLFWFFANGIPFFRITYRLYLLYHQYSQPIVQAIVIGIYLIYIGLFAAILIFPQILLLRYYKTVSAAFLKKQVFNIGGLISLLNLFVFYEYTAGPMAVSVRAILQTGFSRFLGQSEYISTFDYLFWPSATTILTAAVMFTVYKYNRHGHFCFQKKVKINKTLEAVNENMKGLLHSYKNTLFTFQVYTMYIEQAQTEAERQSALQKLQKLETESIEEVSRTLDNLRNIKNIQESSDLIACIRMALNKAVIPEKIQVQLPDMAQTIPINIPEYYMVRVLGNIINNAVEALALQDRGIISIEARKEQEYVFLKIGNNGPGIPKKDQKGIFHSFYSTKKSNKNWGIGLAYVKKVILSYYGHIWVESNGIQGADFCFLIEQPAKITR